jgi:hypothetical protein
MENVVVEMIEDLWMLYDVHQKSLDEVGILA